MANVTKRDGKSEAEARWNYQSIIDLYLMETIPESAKENVDIFVQRVKEQLYRWHMSQKDLAEAAGISEQALSKILHFDPKKRTKTVDLERSRLFAAILKCTPHYLLGLTNDPEKKIDLNGKKVQDAYLPIPQTEVVFAECMKKCTNLEFVRCVCEIVYKSTPENNLMERTKTILVAAGFCDPDSFELEIPPAWSF